MLVRRLPNGDLVLNLDKEDENYLSDLLTDRSNDDSPYKNTKLAKMWQSALERAIPGGNLEET